MFDVFIALTFVLMVVGLCLHHHTMSRDTTDYTTMISSNLKIAAEKSVVASNSVHPIIALVETTSAVATLEELQRQHGPDLIKDCSGIDVVDMLKVISDQKKRILRDVMDQNKNLQRPHPLNDIVGYES